MSITLNDLIPLRQGINTDFRDFNTAATSSDIGKVITMQGQILEKIRQARELALNLNDTERSPFVQRLQDAEQRVRKVAQEVISGKPEKKPLPCKKGIEPLQVTIGEKLSALHGAVKERQVEKALQLQGELTGLLKQLSSIAETLQVGERGVLLGQVRKIEKELEGGISQVLDAPRGGSSDLAPLMSPQELKVMQMQAQVEDFKKIYLFEVANERAPSLAQALREFSAELPLGNLRNAIDGLIQECSDHMQTHLEMQRAFSDQRPLTDYPPVGLKNPKSNCWANGFAQVMINAGIDLRPVQKLQELKESYQGAQTKGMLYSTGADSQQIRLDCPLASNSVEIQEDVAMPFEHYLSKLGHDFEYEEKMERRMRGASGEVLQTITTTTTKKESLIKFPIVGTQDFSTLVQGAFRYENDQQNGFELRLKNAPPHLFFQALRFTYSEGLAGKNNALIPNVPESFTLPKEDIVGEVKDEVYELRGAIIHIGENAGSGHYVTVVKKPGGLWYHINDGVSRKLKPEEVQGYLAQSYIFHYEKK